MRMSGRGGRWKKVRDDPPPRPPASAERARTWAFVAIATSAAILAIAFLVGA